MAWRPKEAVVTWLKRFSRALAAEAVWFLKISFTLKGTLFVFSSSSFLLLLLLLLLILPLIIIIQLLSIINDCLYLLIGYLCCLSWFLFHSYLYYIPFCVHPVRRSSLQALRYHCFSVHPGGCPIVESTFSRCLKHSWRTHLGHELAESKRWIWSS